MGTISSAFNLISGALNADQSALSIVANNVANANAPGYTEETPNWQENDPVNINGVYYGAGVSETGATSVRDRVLTERLNQQQQLAAASTSRLAALNSIQALFTPDSGSASAKGVISAATSPASSAPLRRWRQIQPIMRCASRCFRRGRPWPATSRMRPTV